MSDTPTLAINGGDPVRSKPWLDNFTTGDEEKHAVAQVLDTGYLSMFEGSFHPDPPFRFDGGPAVRRLEDLASDLLDGARVVAVNSATSGLYMAIGALGIGFGDEVIVSPYTMSACAVAPLIYGAIPVFADVEPGGSLSAASIRSRLTPRSRAILVVHQFGIPADMNGIMAIAAEHGLKVIEDCAQAWGAAHGGRPVGTIGDIGVFSFNVNKTIQAGEGGLCVTRDAELAYRLQLIRNHGEAVVGPAGVGDITNLLGHNTRMTEVTAAIAIEQLKKLPALNRHRLELVERLSAGLSRFDFLVPPDGCRGSGRATFYVYPLRYRAELLGGRPRSEFVAAVNAEGIRFYQGYVRPLYSQPLYQKRQAFKHGYPWTAPENRDSAPDYSPGCCPTAERLYDREMIINEHIRPPHGPDDMDDIIAAVAKVAKAMTSTSGGGTGA
jgi:dTDP-4-amino-4,6-dideoxygalactose transaminase